MKVSKSSGVTPARSPIMCIPKSLAITFLPSQDQSLCISLSQSLGQSHGYLVLKQLRSAHLAPWDVAAVEAVARQLAAMHSVTVGGARPPEASEIRRPDLAFQGNLSELHLAGGWP